MKKNIKREYQVCTNCVMDTSDSKIVFDSKGVCDHCNNFYTKILPNWHPDENSKKELESTFAKIKKTHAKKKYDCIIGVSGGVDSSYLVYLAKQYGLRPILYSVDVGWNDPVANENIRKLVEYSGFDFYVNKVDERQFMDFQLSFLKSQISNVDIQDFMIFSGLYSFAVKNKIKYILTGGNFSTESCREPVEWVGLGIDTKLVRDIRKKFSTIKWDKLSFVGIFKYKIFYKYFKGIKVVHPLNKIPYSKQLAIKTLREETGWQTYKNKHFESVFTRFFEGYWLIKKFGFDKRRAHFSSLILSGQLRREEALEILKEPPYPESEAQKDMEYIVKKIGISVEEFKNFMEQPNKTIADYKSSARLINLGAKVLKLFGKEKRNLR